MNATLQNQSKPCKVYHLAIEYSQYSGQENLQKKPSLPNVYKLPKILDVDQEDKTSRKISPFKNIFNTQSQDQMKTNQITDDKSFNIVGKNEVNSYLHKLIKKKNFLQKRNESVLSLSRYSSSVKYQNQTAMCLNKEDVLSFLRPTQNNSPNESKFERQEQMVTIGSNKSKLSQFQMPSLRKSKDAFEQYARTWDREKMRKMKFPSILDHIASYRKKVQQMQFNTLKEKKSHMKQTTWVDTLRGQRSLENFYSDKFVERILKDNENFCLKGKEKLQREMQWIDDKDKSGYTFAFLDNLTIGSGKQNMDENASMNKDENMTESRLNWTLKRDESMVEQGKESENASSIVLKSQTAGNRKGALRESSIGKGVMSKMSKVGLSQFSATGNGFGGDVRDGQEKRNVKIR